MKFYEISEGGKRERTSNFSFGFLLVFEILIKINYKDYTELFYLQRWNNHRR